MKELFAMLVIACYGLSLTAQHVTIVSSNDGEAVPYANVLYLKNDSVIGGAYSDENGVANLKLNDNVEHFEISHVMYEKLVISVKEIVDTIFLKENPHVLEEVSVVASKKQKLTYLGYKPKKVFPGSKLTAHIGYEMVTLIANQDSLDKILKSFVLYTKKSGGLSSSKLKVVFYKNENNSPNEKLPLEIIVDLSEDIKEKVIIDLREYQVVLPKEGIFAGIEWLGCGVEDFQMAGDNKALCNRSIALRYYPEKIEGVISYVRFKLDGNKWVKIEDPESRLMGGYYIPAFGIEVYE